MDLILGFGLFMAGVVVCMVKGFSLAWALLLGASAMGMRLRRKNG